MKARNGFGRKQNNTSTLDQDDLDTLLFMIEEEKMAGDIYDALYDQTGLNVFANIAASEDQHMDVLLAQAEKLGLTLDAILAAPEGEYVNPEIQAMYDDLMAQASTSTEAALNVGVFIEETDIIDLAEASAEVEGTQLATIYDNLLAGSENHLAAFESLLA
ncbi:DUF2202 domain-containing protein [Rhodovulum sp. DZ06]|uniref:DUF2202 domain-containing protein n=1 Tax=Rhodovulum sp. DZ06 TaxID=3425126 RepID=UPI003D34543C